MQDTNKDVPAPECPEDCSLPECNEVTVEILQMFRENCHMDINSENICNNSLNSSITNRMKAVLLFACLFVGCQSIVPEKNVVVLFFDEAELQIETQDQREKLARALEDMFTLKPSQLRKKLYADYQLVKGMWTLKDILHAYYIPALPQRSFDDSDRLYVDAASSSAKSSVKKARDKLLSN